eukprot:1861362-Rhodomonas_salina.1
MEGERERRKKVEREGERKRERERESSSTTALPRSARLCPCDSNTVFPLVGPFSTCKLLVRL